MPDTPADTAKALVAPIIDGVRAALTQTVRTLLAGVKAGERDIEHRMHEQASLDSARYALSHMIQASPIRPRKYNDGGRFELLEHALGLAKLQGFYAEFGVYKGDSLSFLANISDEVIYGFDSFEGLPSDWFFNYRKGFFSLGGKIPEVKTSQQNFRLVKGWFEDSLPTFTSQIDGPAAFLHIDCDLYESTRTVLERLADRIIPGTVIVFAEYLNYPGWERHEFRAFAEFCQARNVSYRYAAFAPAAFSVAVVIESVGGAG